MSEHASWRITLTATAEVPLPTDGQLLVLTVVVVVVVVVLLLLLLLLPWLALDERSRVHNPTRLHAQPPSSKPNRCRDSLCP